MQVHINKIAIRVLTEEYKDYADNPQDYNREYNLIVKALHEQMITQRDGEVISVEHDGVFKITTRGAQ